MGRIKWSGISFAAMVVVATGCGSTATSSTAGSTTTASTVSRLALAAVSATATPAAAGAGPMMSVATSMKYVLSAPLGDLGHAAAVWRMVAHPMSAADRERFAHLLQVGGIPTATNNGWEVADADATLTFMVSSSGVAVSYGSGTGGAVSGSTGAGAGGVANPPSEVSVGPSVQSVPPAPFPVPVTVPTAVPSVAPPPVPIDVPKVNDAQTIARALLDRLGVLAGQDWAADVNASAGVAVACAVGTPCSASAPEVFARTVTFTLILNGTRVDDVNWSVTIGEHRHIESLNGNWASPTTIADYPLRSTTNVFTELQHGTARYVGPQPMIPIEDTPATRTPGGAVSPAVPTTIVQVSGVSLGLARWDAIDHGQPVVDLVPTYRFHSHAEQGPSYDIEVLALDPGAITFTSPVPPPEPLPPEPLPSQPVPAPPATPDNAPATPPKP
jgi:hypothetical protein